MVVFLLWSSPHDFISATPPPPPPPFQLADITEKSLRICLRQIIYESYAVINSVASGQLAITASVTETIRPRAAVQMSRILKSMEAALTAASEAKAAVEKKVVKTDDAALAKRKAEEQAATVISGHYSSRMQPEVKQWLLVLAPFRFHEVGGVFSSPATVDSEDTAPSSSPEAAQLAKQLAKVAERAASNKVHILWVDLLSSSCSSPSTSAVFNSALLSVPWLFAPKLPGCGELNISVVPVQFALQAPLYSPPSADLYLPR